MLFTKVILLTTLLLPAQYGCKKKVDTYSKFIVGCWGTKGGSFNFFNGRGSTFHFYDDGTYIYYGNTTPFGPYSYHIKEDTIFLTNMDPMVIDKMKRNLEHQLVMDVRIPTITGQFSVNETYIKQCKCK